MEDGNVRFSMKRKGRMCFPVNFVTFFSEQVWETVSEYSRIEFCVNIAQLIILSYPTTPRKMFPFKNTRAILSFSSTIDGNTDTVHLIEGFVF